MSNVAIDLTKTVKEIITTMKTAIDNLNTDVSSNKTAIDNLKGQILQAVYPVGSVYVSITDSRDPADILGFGTWEALPAGYGLVAQGTATAEDGSTLTFTAGQKSGEFKHQITVEESASPSHTGTTSTTGAHKHGTWGERQESGTPPYGYYDKNSNHSGSSGGIDNDNALYNTSTDGDHSHTFTTDDTGGNAYHNNVSPGIAAYIWKRVS